MGHYIAPMVTWCFPTQALPKEAEDFPRGGRYAKHMPLLTVSAAKVLLVVETLTKSAAMKLKAAGKLISSHI